jgi:hypothetical protein
MSASKGKFSLAGSFSVFHQVIYFLNIAPPAQKMIEKPLGTSCRMGLKQEPPIPQRGNPNG